MKKAHIFLICLTLIATPAIAAKVKNPFITISEGDVTLRPSFGNIWEPVAVGRILEGLDTLRTGQESRAELNAPSGAIRIYQNTVLTLPEVFQDKDGATDIRSPNVEEGTGLFKIRWRGRKNRFNVTTKHVVAVVKGTTFAVRRNGIESTVACIFGKVVVTAKDQSVTDRKIHLGPGMMVTFTEGVGFGPVLNFEPNMQIWGLWEDEFEFEVTGEEGYTIGGRFGGEGAECPDEDILW